MRLKNLLLVIGLLLSVLAQSAYAQAPDTNPRQWAGEIAAFARQDSLTPPPTGGIVFTGSSSIRMWETLAADFPGYKVINRGFGGSQLPDVTYYFNALITKYKPRQVVLYSGDNDIAAGNSPQQVFEAFCALAMRLHHELPRTQLLYIAIKPSIARFGQYGQMKQANDMIASFIRRNRRMKFLDVGPAMLGPDGKPRPELFREDGLHMTRAGYQLWTGLVAPKLVK